MILGPVSLALAIDEEFFVPDYNEVALNKAFSIEYTTEQAFYKYDTVSGYLNLTMLKIVNPNLKGLNMFMSRVFKAVEEENLAELSGMISESFVFFFCYVSKDHLKAIGWEDEWVNLFLTPDVFKDFRGIDTLTMGDSEWQEWRGEEGLKRMFRYLTKESLLAAISGGCFVNADKKAFDELLGNLPYEEIVKRLKEETVDLDKGTYWATPLQLRKLFGDGKVHSPYFVGNILLPRRFKVYPPDYEGLRAFMPPHLVFTIGWNYKKSKWELESVSYGWFRIPD